VKIALLLLGLPVDATDCAAGRSYVGPGAYAVVGSNPAKASRIHGHVTFTGLAPELGRIGRGLAFRQLE